MATTKKRINISISNEVRRALETLARRDEVPAATKAGELIRTALAIEEDFAFAHMADTRLGSLKKTLSHKKVWS